MASASAQHSSERMTHAASPRERGSKGIIDPRPLSGGEVTVSSYFLVFIYNLVFI
jgi:hypothetical protein